MPMPRLTPPATNAAPPSLARVLELSTDKKHDNSHDLNYNHNEMIASLDELDWAYVSNCFSNFWSSPYPFLIAIAP